MNQSLTVGDRLAALLAELYAKGTIPRNRHGHIARDQLAGMLGVGKTSLTPHLALVNSYQEKIGILHPIDAAIPRMKALLAELIDAGTLTVRDGRVDRKQVGDLAGVNSVTSLMDRFPQLREFFKDADDHINAIGYHPRDVAEALARLDVFLASEKALAKNGLTFDCVKIGELIDFPGHRLRMAPFIGLVKAAEAKYEAGLREEGLTGFFHGRIFQFASLVIAGWNSKLIRQMVPIFANEFSERPKGSAEAAYLAVTLFLRWVAQSKSDHVSPVFSLLNSGSHPQSNDWFQTLFEFNAFVGETVASEKNTLSPVQNFLRALATQGIAPHMPMSFKSRGKREKAGRYATVAEALPISKPVKRSEQANADDYLLFATEMLAQAGAMRGVEIDAADQSAFSISLRAELETADIVVDDNPALVIRRIMRRRISLIEEAASKRFEKSMATYEEGQELLRIGQDCSDAWELLTTRAEGNASYAQTMRRWFPKDDPKQAKANLLKSILIKFGGVVPSLTTAPEHEYTFLLKRANEHNGLVDLQSCLWPHSDAFSAATVLYLIQTGANSSVGRIMPADPLTPSSEPGFHTATSFKGKARGKAIFSDMKSNCMAAKSLLWLTDVRKHPPFKVAVEDNRYLNVIRGKSHLSLMRPELLLAFFKDLILSIPELSDLRITPSMLRPTVLLLAALESDGRVRASVTLGQHGENVNQRYTGRYPVMFMHDSEMTLFNRFYETLALQKVEGAHVILGVDEASFAKRLETIARTGLGTLCGNPNGHPGLEGERCTKLDCYDCPQLILIAKAEEIALLRIWQKTLRAVEGDWLRDHPERWEAIWLPWLCFVDAVEARMKISYRRVWRDAGLLAEEIIASPNFAPQKPW